MNTENTSIYQPSIPPQSFLQKMANSLSDPDHAALLSLTTLIPLARAGRRWAAKHPAVTIGLVGLIAVGLFMKPSVKNQMLRSQRKDRSKNRLLDKEDLLH